MMQPSTPGTLKRPSSFRGLPTSSPSVELNTILQGSVSAWKRCRPGNEIKVFHVNSSESGSPAEQQNTNCAPRIKVETFKGNDYPSLVGSNVNITVVPIVTNLSAVEGGIGLGQTLTLQRLFRDCRIPESALTAFLDNRIHFTCFPTPRSKRINYQLCFRQWSLCWCTDSDTKRTNAILLWVGGSWAHVIASVVESSLRSMDPFPMEAMAPGFLASILCIKNVSASLADLDSESFQTERRLREVKQTNGALKFDDELGRLSADHSWVASRAIRERIRISNVQNFLEFAAKHQTALAERDPDLLDRVEEDYNYIVEPLRLLANSLHVQASKLCDETSMHLSTLYNLIAQRDQSSNIAIASASKEIALQSKLDQTISLEIAEASKEIAEEAKRDSRAMKQIAITTLLFLPGTFLASCFSMPLFSWSAPGTEVINPRIWIFVALTVCLTAFTAGAFAFWLHWESRANKKTPEIPKLKRSSITSAMNEKVPMSKSEELVEPASTHPNLSLTAAKTVNMDDKPVVDLPVALPAETQHSHVNGFGNVSRGRDRSRSVHLADRFRSDRLQKSRSRSRSRNGDYPTRSKADDEGMSPVRHEHLSSMRFRGAERSSPTYPDLF